MDYYLHLVSETNEAQRIKNSQNYIARQSLDLKSWASPRNIYSLIKLLFLKHSIGEKSDLKIKEFSLANDKVRLVTFFLKSIQGWRVWKRQV